MNIIIQHNVNADVRAYRTVAGKLIKWLKSFQNQLLVVFQWEELLHIATVIVLFAVRESMRGMRARYIRSTFWPRPIPIFLYISMEL